MKQILSTFVALSILTSLISACTTAPGSSQTTVPTSTSESGNPVTSSESSSTPTRSMMGGGGIDKSSDTALQAVISEVEDKFQQLEYQDAESGKTIQYNLFVPENYDSSQKYPLVLFITDSSVVGKDTTAALEQGYGAVIWATAEDQTKHPAFILAPEYSENILAGENGVTDYVSATLRLLETLQKTYSIDANRLYITGQSMGCMAALYLNATYPDLFAASLFVDGQWDVSILKPLEEQKFFYFAAGGDQKASTGMNEVISMFDNDGVAYGQTTLNAKDTSDVIDTSVLELIAKGNNANFVNWETGSVLPNGVTSQGANEHMYSFDHAYQVTAVRDWLFDQVKTTN